MVIRYHLRRFLLPLAVYCVSAMVVGYFVYHAQHGNRGIETKIALKQEIFRLEGELDELKREKATWERRVAMLRGGGLDRDLLEERARLDLNRLHRNDVVIMTGEGSSAN